MPSTKPAYSPEFKAEAVKLYRSSGHSLKSVAGNLGVSANSLRIWIRQAEANDLPANSFTTDERVELARLQRENHILKEEQEILRKATAFFVKETNR